MDTKKTLNNDEIIAQIRQGNEKALSPIYEANRKAFIKWAIWHYKCDEYDASDVYQKSFSIFYFNIKDGKLTELTSKIETYLFAIGKRVFMEKHREKYQQMKVAMDDAPSLEVSHLDTSYFDEEKHTQQQLVIAQMMKKLGEPCSSILISYYYHHFSMEAIAEEYGYKNDLVAKKKKYECLQKIKKIADTGGINADDLLQ